MKTFPQLNFGLEDTTNLLRESVQGFVSTEIAPLAAEIDRQDHFPAELWAKMGALGLLGITVSEEYGGAEMGYLEHVIAMEEISRGSAVNCSETPKIDGAATTYHLAQVQRTGAR